MEVGRQAKLKDVAVRAGVSLGAVSRVLNGGRTAISVTAGTRRRILQAASDLRYRPNLTARALSGKSVSLIGIVGAGLDLYHTSMQTSSLMVAAAGRGYYTLVDVVPRGGGGGGRQPAEGLRRLLSYNPDGIVFMRAPGEELLREVTCPSVVLSTHDRSRSDVFLDRETGGYMAGLHLLRHGRRRVFFLTTSLAENEEKHRGLRRAWRDAGLSPEDVPLLEHPGRADGGGEDGFEARLRRELASGACGAFCANDFLAARLITRLGRLGVRCPEDFSVVGFDGDSFSGFLTPPLTTVVQPFSAAAGLAVDLLLEKIRDRDCDPRRRRRHVLLPGFHLGESCGCPPVDAPFWKPDEDRLLLESAVPERILDCRRFLELHRDLAAAPPPDGPDAQEEPPKAGPARPDRMTDPPDRTPGPHLPEDAAAAPPGSNESQERSSRK